MRFFLLGFLAASILSATLAWSGPFARPLFGPLLALERIVGGERACTYQPNPSVPAHHFRSTAFATSDGNFIVLRYFNQGISEIETIAFDARHRRYIRTSLSKDGAADVAVSSASGTAQTWHSLWDISGKAVRTSIASMPDGAYRFAASNLPGSGRCEASTTHG